MTFLVCFEGIGCSQDTDPVYFNYTDPDGCLKIHIKFEVNITYEQMVCSVLSGVADPNAVCKGSAMQDYDVSVSAAILNTLHHPQDGKKNWTVIPGNDFSAEPSMFTCAPESAASITITWMENFYLTLNFDAVSNVIM